jgi:alpha-glucosidase/alpha-D-xyloside xylohydrolase
MHARITRRDALKNLGVTAAGLVAAERVGHSQSGELTAAGRPVEIAVTSVSPVTVRITVREIAAGTITPVPATGALTQEEFGAVLARGRSSKPLARVGAGTLRVRVTEGPPTIHIESAKGTPIQRLTLDASQPGMSFLLPKGPLLGLGEGGVQFDKKGSTDQMRNGQVTSDVDGYRLAIHGTRAPVQWLIGTDGWGLFIHQPYGTFDFRGELGNFTPREDAPLPLDVFVVHAQGEAMLREYARITGLPELPPKWGFGYQQSSRTLAGPEEILGIARTFRQKRLPCETLIYLGTEFAPSGWNTRNGEFTWHPTKSSRGAASSDRSTTRARLPRCLRDAPQTIGGRRIDKCRATGPPTSRSWTLAWMAGGRIKATASMVRRGSTATACIGRAHSPIDRTSVPLRCIATRLPAFSASAASSGPATCKRGGRR